MRCGIGVAVLALVACVAVLVDTAIVDLGITKEVEEVIEKDDFVLSLQGIKPKKRGRVVKETLFAVDFPGAQYKLALILDRRTKRVIVHTLEDVHMRSQRFTVDTLHDDTTIKSLVLAVNQTQPGAHANLYIDCVYYGMIATPKSLRDMYKSMDNPKMEVFHEKRYTMEVDYLKDLQMVLSRNECPLPLENPFSRKINTYFDDDINNYFKADPNVHSFKPDHEVQKRQIPPVNILDENELMMLFNKLIDAVNLEVRRCEDTTRSLIELKQLITECELCKKRPKVTVCEADRFCFPGVRCTNTIHGPMCGTCPAGFTGDGKTCIRFCASNPCFKGVECTDEPKGAKCGPCPEGMEGDGRTCVRIDLCDHNRCAPGLQCHPTEEHPYYKCVQCPEGMASNGFKCIDIDECDLVQPCDPRVECTNLSPGYRCGPCPPGFTGSGDVQGIGILYAETHRQICVDINECADGKPCPPRPKCNNVECDKNAECIDLGYGEYVCRCRIGWAGNGEICGPDRDLDRYPDIPLNCSEPNCKLDNCINIPNSGQEDTDQDGVGDACDKEIEDNGVKQEYICPPNSYSNPNQEDSERTGGNNSDQSDIDEDGIRDACDDDMDNDGIVNGEDNCPKVPNPDQSDRDDDRIGDFCDNCPDIYNPKQEDQNENLIGDVCDSSIDTDSDGRPDNFDNCKFIPNPSQVDTDQDGLGDQCDDDIDNDGIPNEKDNCVYWFNPDQKDEDNNNIGDICENDYDYDSKMNHMDACPNNSLIYQTDFSKYQTVALDPEGESQIDPDWQLYNFGKEIVQTTNSDPGLAIGYDNFHGVDFEGTFFVDTDLDDDYVGFVFSYQSNSKFYTVMWKKNQQTYWQSAPFRAVAEPGIQIKVVESETGPGQLLRNSLWHTGDTPNQVKTLWRDPKNVGWKEKTSYRWFLIHRPAIGLIRLKIFDEHGMITDSGNIFDSTYAGGRLGVLCFSQEMIIWSDLVYRCNDNLKKEIYDELPQDKKDKVSIDNTRLFTFA